MQAALPTPSRLQPRPPQRARSCTWVAGPPGGGGATLQPVPGATHRLLTTKGPRGLSPAPPPALHRVLQALRSLALARLPAAVAPWPTGVGRTRGACRPGSEITGRPACLAPRPQVIAPPSDPPGSQVASPPHPCPFDSSLWSTSWMRAWRGRRDPGHRGPERHAQGPTAGFQSRPGSASPTFPFKPFPGPQSPPL